MALVSTARANYFILPAALVEFSRYDIVHIHIIIREMILCAFGALAGVIRKVSEPEVNNVGLGILFHVFNYRVSHFFDNVGIRITKLCGNGGYQ